MTTEATIRNVAVPLPIETIKEYFNDKSIFFHVDYSESKLKDKIFLTYLGNLDIPCDIVLGDNISDESLFTLIKDYMEIKNISKLHTLNMAVAQIMLKASSVDIKDVFVNPVLTDHQINTFIEDNKDLVERWLHFIDSTMVYLVYIFKELDEELKTQEQFEVVDDPNYVGLNVVNLFDVEGFLELYFAVDRPLRTSYFVRQFEEYMFKGESLFPYYYKENNFFVGLLGGLINGDIPFDPKDVFGGEAVEEAVDNG